MAAKSTKNHLFFAIVCFIASLGVFFYKLPESFFFNPDFARDLYFVTNIVTGKLTLIGPKLTFGGLYSGPYYFYMFAPIYFLTKFNIYSLLFFNALIFALAVTYFAYKVRSQFSWWKALLATTALVVSPLFILTARNPSNAFTYVAPLLFMLTYMYFNGIKSFKELLFFGFLCGVLVNFHPVTVAVIPFMFVYTFLFLADKRKILAMFAGGAAAFLPLIAFEIKHNFVIFKNTFIEKSYLKWLNSQNIPGGLSGHKNVFLNMGFLAEQMKPVLATHPALHFVAMGVLYFLNKFKPMSREGLLLFGSIASYIIISIVLRSQFITHYLFAAATLILFTVVIYLLKSCYSLLLAGLIIIQVMSFPIYLYLPSGRTHHQNEAAVNYVINNKLLDKNTNFNVIQVTVPDMLAPIAFEYRHFFKQKGYVPTSEFMYKTSNVLFIFSEIPDLDINTMNTWEVNEFGKEHFKNAKKYQSGKITIYRIEK